MIKRQRGYRVIIFIKIPMPSIKLLIIIQAVHICPTMPSNDILNGNGLSKNKTNHIPVKITPIIMKLSTVHFAIIRSILCYCINYHRLHTVYKTDVFCFYKVLIMKYILRQMLLSQIGELFCKYCGSDRITDVKVTNHLSRTKMLEPSVGFSEIKLSLGSLSKKNVQDYTYDSTLCQTCINIHVIDQSDIVHPFEIQSSNNQTSIIIPYTLQVQLKNLQYQEDEIIKLIHGVRIKLDKIHKRWSKRGHNPCKRGNMGYKLSLKLKRGTKINPYVIVDRIQDRIVFRLCYGGGKVDCQ